MVPNKIDSYINNTEKRRFHLNDTWVPSLFSFICPLYLDKSNLKLFPYLSVNLVIFTPGRESFKFDIFKCLHLVDLNNPRILMTHDKMAVAANTGG